jgi:sugar phosphate isomerase/epimerase
MVILNGIPYSRVDVDTLPAAKVKVAQLDRNNGAARDQTPSIWSRDNLHVWEVANWDFVRRSSDERARLLATFGIKHYAYLGTVDPYGAKPDFGASHLDVDAEIGAMKKYGIDIRAWFFWLNTDDPTRDPLIATALEAFKRHSIHPQIWVPQAMEENPVNLLNPGSKEGFPTGDSEQRDRVRREAERIATFVRLATPYGCTVNLYNHQGWFGMMENQLAILDELSRQGITNVGLCYNPGHAISATHDDAKVFTTLWGRIQPHVVAVNVVVWGARELGMMRIIQNSGWRGAVGIFPFFGNMEFCIRNALWMMEWVREELNQPATVETD